ncbi:MAG TPA: 16S rRNA (adenine(1518)-N(6)/adenine(1519)-N(6))-dimethyltransferase RsmA [Alphaproteobacteria bacterium]|nr:16S rRNA (adenine(1518)-N(6)/adenine(1519)-N(6))-dimethyltransferase RsmA [Alphaproteobacteria bacterium]
MTGDLLPPLRDVIAQHGLRARKSLGQNFLLDLNLTGRIARSAGPLENCTVVEVGPGPGGLTRALLQQGARQIIAIEKDQRCLAALGDIAAAYPGRLQIIEGDALDFELADLAEPPIKLIANLPYNVATPLLIKWLTPDHWPPVWESLTLMFQKEVAERITAPPGGKAYGRLAVLAQWRCDAHMLFDIDPRAFTPAPKVTSTVVQITPRATPRAGAELADLQIVAAAAFGQRRKMLRRSLTPLGVDTNLLLETAAITPTARAEEIDIEGFCALARAYRNLRQIR